MTDNEFASTKEALAIIKNTSLSINCQKLYDHLCKNHNYLECPAAKTHHHNYKGGLDTHTAEVMFIALRLNEEIGSPFDPDRVLLVAFLHDLAKTYVYRFIQRNGMQIIDFINYSCSQEAIVFQLCGRFGIELSFDELSAIEFAHGGWSTQASDRYIQNSDLSVLLHCADMISSRFGKVKI